MEDVILEISAQPVNYNWRFDSWTSDNTEVSPHQNPLRLSMSDNRSLTANFVYNPKKHEIPGGITLALSCSSDNSHLVVVNDESSIPHLYLIDLKTSRTFLPAFYHAEHPTWSPDGKHLAFTMFDSDSEIYVIDANGLNLTRLTSNPDTDDYPCWSPDGSQIAFISRRSGTKSIYIMNSDGTNPTKLIDTFGNSISWCAANNKIAFCTNRLYYINPDGSEYTDSLQLAQQAVWSPNGRLLLTAYAGSPMVVGYDSSEGGSLRNVDLTRMQWSGDSEYILIGTDAGAIMTDANNTSREVELSMPWSVSIQALDWNWKSRTIYYATSEGVFNVFDYEK
jgi:Tol biopolymer transport system component